MELKVYSGYLLEIFSAIVCGGDNDDSKLMTVGYQKTTVG